MKKVCFPNHPHCPASLNSYSQICLLLWSLCFRIWTSVIVVAALLESSKKHVSKRNFDLNSNEKFVINFGSSNATKSTNMVSTPVRNRNMRLIRSPRARATMNITIHSKTRCNSSEQMISSVVRIAEKPTRASQHSTITWSRTQATQSLSVWELNVKSFRKSIYLSARFVQDNLNKSSTCKYTCRTTLELNHLSVLFVGRGFHARMRWRFTWHRTRTNATSVAMCAVRPLNKKVT